ncbi:Ribonuclease HII [Diplonema papillatum]|nr:Ribonuclease HII [Diplonema papillatum]
MKPTRALGALAHRPEIRAIVSDSLKALNMAGAASKKKAGQPYETIEVDGAAWRLMKTGATPSRKQKKDPAADYRALVSLARAAEVLKGEWGVDQIVGVDEAGRGCWAGVVSAGAAVLPGDVLIEGVKDSKLLTEKARESILSELLDHLTGSDLSAAVDLRLPVEIDRTDILSCTRLAMLTCVQLLAAQAAHSGRPMTVGNTAVVFDGRAIIPKARRFAPLANSAQGVVWDPRLPLRAVEIEKGDSLFLPVATASIVAKTVRDGTMVSLDRVLPAYGFAKHKSYGTKQHQQSLASLGPIRGIHRQTFSPMKTMVNWVDGEVAPGTTEWAKQTGETRMWI